MARADAGDGWLEALRAHDEGAWSDVHEREFPRLYRFALGLGADPALAEDCASEAFVRLVKTLPRLRLESPVALRAWLTVVVRNYLIDQFRRRRDSRLPATDLPSPDVDPLTRVVLASALAGLPAAQREVVSLRFVVGLPTSEVAALSGRSVKAVESLQHRALGALRRSPALRGDDQ